MGLSRTLLVTTGLAVAVSMTIAGPFAAHPIDQGHAHISDSHIDETSAVT